jgi:TonB-linked SusC/RagA family outer membrane protein
MKIRILSLLMGIFLVAAQASAQQKTVTGKVTDEQSAPIAGASVIVKGTTVGAITNAAGNYSIRATVGQVLQFRFIGTIAMERIVGADNVINAQLKRTPTSLDAVVVTALGQTTAQRALGTSQQTVVGADIAQTRRENFINALQGRVAGVDVTSTSGVPGASSSITIRGISSISSSNQPLMIVDGLPIDNKTMNTNVLASDAPGSPTAFNNRGLDFNNRSSDINPEDIETLTVLKGPEAAVLYGIDAANGAIIITTKRGRLGGGLEYSNTFRGEHINSSPEVQHVYGPSPIITTTFNYFGAPYADTTHFYNNIDGFFRNAFSQQHNLSFSGAAADSRLNYRVASAFVRQQGVIPGSVYNRVNLTGSSQGQVNRWLSADLSMMYSNSDNDQPFKGDNGPLIGLLVWPTTDNASDYLSPAGTRRRYSNLAATSELDNPYFSINKNRKNERNNRITTNLSLTIAPFSWGNLNTRVGSDYYTDQNQILRHPESVFGVTQNGLLDVADDITRNITSQTVLSFNSRQLGRGFSISGLVGNAIYDQKSNVDALQGANFLDPNFVSVNNTYSRTSRTTISQRRLVGAFGHAVLDYNDYLYLTADGRNDWTSTIPAERNSFFYPGASASFIFTSAFPSLQRFFTSGKLRAGYAKVGKDARPYAYATALEFKTTANGGYGYGFYGPNFKLKPEFATEYEFGTELSWFNDRLGVDATMYRKKTTDQIVNDIRGSYATGFILFNLNGASTENKGLELTVRGTPVQRANFSWDVTANFDRARGKTLALPNGLPESYVSDTWLYANVRNGTEPGLSILSLTGLFYQRNNQGKLLIDPTTGLALRSATFIDAGYDRQPDYTVGLSNNFRYKRFSLNFLLDFRKGGDIFNATEAYLTTKGLSKETLDRDTPRVVAGVLRDGKENSANPTVNTIVITPSTNTGYYTNMSEELFIEKNINWVRLRDVTLSFALPERFARNASVYVTGTDLFLLTNYSGLDPIVNGNDAAVGGSSGIGIDYGNFPVPRGLNIGIRMGF